ncbi:hypothetical protein GCWU000282_02546 [Catonella morbi ATCC 51271]|uniref:Single-strand binding family protein n=1 Tax=Catonella morbi ATCC 51271 TaxID=592026 RepID=V2Y3X9_9FIRM|nr:hypothetical protein [Catonella morbi]ESL02411.1 hypothetical protein GCWU000282_02546 [Catonella morbi ATCC 51271]
MNYEIIRDKIEDMVNDNHRDFVKAIISMEKGINDEDALDRLYDFYMENDSANLLNEEFDVMIEELREQGQIKDIPYIRKEKDELVDIVGNIAGKVDVVERENKKGESFKVVNFSVVSNDSLGNKVYHNCSAYGEKGDIPKNFKQGDFVKIFGQVRISADGNGKEYRNVNILSSKLLKAKEQRNEVSNSQETATFEKDMKDSKKAEKESVRKTINKYKDENKETAKPKKEIIKEMKEKYFID